VSHGGARFFGTLDLTTSVSEGVTLAVGIRNSNDQSFPIGFCCGQRVFVCDNLAFTSEIIVSKKYTRFGQERYLEGLARAVGSRHGAGDPHGSVERFQNENESRSSNSMRIR